VKTALYLIAAIALTGCVAPVRVTHVSGPDGAPAVVLSCHHEANCYERAGELCPAGYDTLNETSGFAIVPTAYGPVGASRESLLIRCKS
jgi:hypothetical protein